MTTKCLVFLLLANKDLYTNLLKVWNCKSYFCKQLNGKQLCPNVYTFYDILDQSEFRSVLPVCEGGGDISTIGRAWLDVAINVV